MHAGLQQQMSRHPHCTALHNAHHAAKSMHSRHIHVSMLNHCLVLLYNSLHVLTLTVAATVYRSWLRDQVGKDPELSAQWVQWEAQGLISPRAPSRQPPAPWADTPSANPHGSSSGSSSSNACASGGAVLPPPPHLHIHLQHQQSHRRGEPDLREQIARQLAASQGPCSHDLQAVAAVVAGGGAERCHPMQPAAGSGAGGCSSSNSGGSSKGGLHDSPRSKAGSKGGGGSSAGSSPTRRAELSRTQLKAVRKLFPIRAPSLKPAAALQVGP